MKANEMIEELTGLYGWLWTGLPLAIFRKIFPEPIRPEDYRWSKYSPIFEPKVRLADGKWSGNGQLWRRRSASGKWEYQQDTETVEDQMSRIA